MATLPEAWDYFKTQFATQESVILPLIVVIVGSFIIYLIQLRNDGGKCIVYEMLPFYTPPKERSPEDRNARGITQLRESRWRYTTLLGAACFITCFAMGFIAPLYYCFFFTVMVTVGVVASIGGDELTGYAGACVMGLIAGAAIRFIGGSLVRIIVNGVTAEGL